MTALFAPLSAIIASLQHRKAFGMSMLQIPRKNLLKEHFSALCFPSFTAEPRGRFYSFELSQIHFQFPFSHENSFFSYSLAASIQFLTFFFSRAELEVFALCRLECYHMISSRCGSPKQLLDDETETSELKNGLKHMLLFFHYSLETLIDGDESTLSAHVNNWMSWRLFRCYQIFSM